MKIEIGMNNGDSIFCDTTFISLNSFIKTIGVTTYLQLDEKTIVKASNINWLKDVTK